MTEDEYRQTDAFKNLPQAEKVRALAMIRKNGGQVPVLPDAPASAEPDPNSTPIVQPVPRPRESSRMQRFREELAEHDYEPPKRTDTPWRTFAGPVAEQTFGETYSERYNPATDPVERAIRSVTGIIQGIGAVGEQAVENIPRLWGGQPVSSPASRAVPPATEALAAIAPIPGPRGFGVGRTLRAAEEAAIPLSASERVASPTLARVEGVVERALGGGRMGEFRETQRQATQRAVEGVGERRAPLPATPQVTEEAFRVGGAKAEQQAAAPAATEVTQLGGREMDAPTFHKTITDTYRRGHAQARTEGHERYENIFRQYGDAPVVTRDHSRAVATKILEYEQSMPGAQRPGVVRMAGAVEGAAPPPTAAAQFIQQYGLVDEGALSLRQAHDLRSRVRDTIRTGRRTGKTGAELRQLDELEKALTRDIDGFAARAGGTVGADLRAADEYWRTRVAEPYGPRTLLSKLTDNKSTAESLEKALYDPRGFEQIQQLKREMDLVDPGAWDLVKRRWGQKLMDAAVDKTTGAWSEKKFVEAVLKHSPESIDAILGSSAAPFTNMVRRYQKSMADPTAPGSPLQAAHLFREFVGSNGEVIVAGLGKRTPQELATMRQLVGDQKWERITRSWWEDVVLKGAKDPNQQVTRARFLTQLRKVSDDQLTELLGPKGATEFKEFRDLLQYQEKLASVRVKESGTGQTMVPLYQAGAAASAIGALAHGLVVGNKTEIIGGATGIGLSVTPAVLAYALSNPQGIRLLSAVVRQFPDAKTAITRFGIWAGQKGLQTHPPKTDVSPFFQPAEVPSAKLQ